jgi:hypothetical protein
MRRGARLRAPPIGPPNVPGRGIVTVVPVTSSTDRVFRFQAPCPLGSATERCLPYSPNSVAATSLRCVRQCMHHTHPDSVWSSPCPGTGKPQRNKDKKTQLVCRALPSSAGRLRVLLVHANSVVSTNRSPLLWTAKYGRSRTVIHPLPDHPPCGPRRRRQRPTADIYPSRSRNGHTITKRPALDACPSITKYIADRRWPKLAHLRQL